MTLLSVTDINLFGKIKTIAVLTTILMCSSQDKEKISNLKEKR